MTDKALRRVTKALAAVEARLAALEHAAREPAPAQDRVPATVEPAVDHATTQSGAQLVGPITPDAPPGTWWALDELATRTGPAFDRDGAAGSVAYAGRVRTPGAGDLAWQMEHPAPDLLEQGWSGAADVLSALGHPVRLAIVQHLLRGARTLQDLLQIDGLGTTGQLQHHLRELRTAGLVEQPRRNDYAVPVRHVVPCLVIIAAASDAGRPA